MNIKRKFLSIIAILALLSACVTMPPNLKRNAVIQSGNGVVVVQLDYTTKNHILGADLQLQYLGEKSRTGLDGALIFKTASYLAVIELPADKYNFLRFRMGEAFIPVRNSSFVVKENSITYLGDIKTGVHYKRGSGSKLSLEVEDNFESVKHKLKNTYPELYEKMEIEKRLVSF